MYEVPNIRKLKNTVLSLL